MYLQHFGLKELPFGLTPDTGFFFASRTAQQALNTLLVAARSGEGFIKVVGEVGSGKTLLCRQLLRCVGDDFHTAYVPNPALTPPGLLLALAEELGVDTAQALQQADATQHQHLLLKALERRLLELAGGDRRVLLCLDEVQAMPVETLEALRLLTNLETEKRKLLQVVVFGQPELDEKLAHPCIRQLRQRITFEARLAPLDAPELSRYLEHRLAVAGYDGARVFSRAALWLLRRRTRGWPRLVNIVAHKALLCAYGAGRRRVGLREVREAVADTASLRTPPRRAVLAATVGAAAMAAVGALMLFARMR